MKKEPLSIIAVKTLLAVIIFAGVMTIIVGGGWLIENDQKNVKTQKVSEENIPVEKTAQVKLYFNNNKSVKEGGCKSTASVVRTISNEKETEKMAKIAINELINGPTQEEKEQGFYFLARGIPLKKDRVEKHKKYLENEMLNPAIYEDRVRVKSLEIKEGVAYVDFNLALNATCVIDKKGACMYFDSCENTSLQTAIDNTLKQFSEIKDVVITVEGEKYPCSDTNCFKRLEFELGKSDVFIETAQPREGITHLARRALDKYLKQINHVEKIKLTEEQKVYIEDYLQNKIGSEFLKVGESKEFSAELIEEAILNSQNLSSFAQQGLIKYILFGPTSIEAGVIPDKEEDSMTIWFRYLDPNNNLISDAKVSLILTSPKKHEYNVDFSKINNYYYVTLYYVSRFKNLYCFQVKASKGTYEPQEKNLGCLKLSEYETTFKFTGKSEF
ncbi:MAG: hypothetical protein GWO87_03035 [Xanthomonadaceae bacterium]|nr:hypothetical protein [Rhodospirillaceae bacterium]NIA18137.1 hypothetical protein [Xanthomonadaceae bacterium]